MLINSFVHYAGQLNCSLCKICDINALTSGICMPGGTRDVVNCSCNAGYEGNGVSCELCSNKTINWLTNNCLNVNRSFVEKIIKQRGKAVEWCQAPSGTACTYEFPSYRAIFSAGNTTLSESLASGQFLVSSVTPALAAQAMNMAFSKNAGGSGVSCTITADGSSCNGVIALLAVPGLLLSTVPGHCIQCFKHSYQMTGQH